MEKKNINWFSFGLGGMFIGFIIAWVLRFIKGESAFGIKALGPIAMGDLLLIAGFMIGAIIGLVLREEKRM